MTDDEILLVRIVGATDARDVGAWNVEDEVWSPSFGLGFVSFVNNTNRYIYVAWISSEGPTLSYYTLPSLPRGELLRLPDMDESP